MFTKSKVFAGLLLSVSSCVAVFAQTPPPPAPTAPSAPNAPEVFTQFFTSDGGYLGIQSQEVTKENFSRFGLRDVRGVAVQQVIENSPAARAGLQANDVIVRFDGEEVSSVRKLTRLIGEVAPDHQVRMTVLRGGSEREITATLGARPSPNFGEGSFSTTIPSMPRVPMQSMPRVIPFGEEFRVAPSVRGGGNVYTFGNSRQIGVGVAALNDQLGDYFGVSGGRGLLVNNVRENSPAAKAGLRAGDVIVEVDGKAVAGSLDLTRALSEKTEGDVSLTIIRNKNRQNVRVTPEKMSNGGQFEFFREGDGNNLRRVQPMRRVAPRPATPPRVLRTNPRTL